MNKNQKMLKEFMELKKRFETTEKKEFEEAYEEVIKMRKASRFCEGLFQNLLFSGDTKLARFYVYVVLRDEVERSIALGEAHKNRVLFKLTGRSNDETENT